MNFKKRFEHSNVLVLATVLVIATFATFALEARQGYFGRWPFSNGASVALSLSTIGVTTSSSASGYPGTNITDSDPGTAWIAATALSTANNFAWVQLDLKTNQYVNSIEWKSAATPALAGAMNDFVIKVSTDGSIWTPVYVQAGSMQTDTGTIPLGVNARYIRIESTKVGDGTGYAASVSSMVIMTSPLAPNPSCSYTFSPSNFLSTSNVGGIHLNNLPSGTADHWTMVCLSPGTYNVASDNPIVIASKHHIQFMQTPGTTGTVLIQGHMPAYTLLSSPASNGSMYQKAARSAPFTITASDHITVKNISFKNTYTFDEVPQDQNQKTLSRTLSQNQTLFHCAETYGPSDTYGDYHSSGLYANQQKQNLCLSVITESYSEVSNAVWITYSKNIILQNSSFVSYGKQTVNITNLDNAIINNSTVVGDYFILNSGGGSSTTNSDSSGSLYVYNSSLTQDGISSNEPWDEHSMLYMHNTNMTFDSIEATAQVTGQSFITGYQHPYDRVVIKGSNYIGGSHLVSWMDAFAGAGGLDPFTGSIFLFGSAASLNPFTVNPVGGNTGGSSSAFICTYSTATYGVRSEPNCVNGSGTPPGTSFTLPVVTLPTIPVTGTTVSSNTSLPLSSNVSLEGGWATSAASLRLNSATDKTWNFINNTSTVVHQLNKYLAVSGADTSDLWTLTFTAKPFGPHPPTAIAGYVLNTDTQSSSYGMVWCYFNSQRVSGGSGKNSSNFSYTKTSSNGSYTCSVTVKLDSAQGAHIRIAFNLANSTNDGESGVTLSNISLNAKLATPAATWSTQTLGSWDPQGDATLTSRSAPFTNIEGVATTFHGFQQYATVPAATVWRFTFEVKPVGPSTHSVRIYLMDSNDQDGTYGGSNCLLGGNVVPGNFVGTNAKILASSTTAIGDGWYRCTETVLLNSSPTQLRVVADIVAPGSVYQGNGQSGIMVRNPVLEYQVGQ